MQRVCCTASHTPLSCWSFTHSRAAFGERERGSWVSEKLVGWCGMAAQQFDCILWHVRMDVERAGGRARARVRYIRSAAGIVVGIALIILCRAAAFGRAISPLKQ